MGKTRVYEWRKRFHDGRKDADDDGRPRTSTTDENAEKAKEMVIAEWEKFADDTRICPNRRRLNIFRCFSNTARSETFGELQPRRAVRMYKLGGSPRAVRRLLTPPRRHVHTRHFGIRTKCTPLIVTSVRRISAPRNVRRR